MMCPSSFSSQYQRQDSNPSLSKNLGLFPPRYPTSFSKSGQELESNRENGSCGRKKGTEKWVLFTYLCIHVDYRSGTRYSLAVVSTSCFCSHALTSYCVIAPRDPILLSFWSPLQFARPLEFNSIHQENRKWPNVLVSETPGKINMATA